MGFLSEAVVWGRDRTVVGHSRGGLEESITLVFDLAFWSVTWPSWEPELSGRPAQEPYGLDLRGTPIGECCLQRW